MRLISLICIFFFLIPIFSVQTVSAQPDFEVGDWDIGFKDGENITKELRKHTDRPIQVRYKFTNRIHGKRNATPLSADLKKPTKVDKFAEKFPHKYIECGSKKIKQNKKI